jgi:hypothetical protein
MSKKIASDADEDRREQAEERETLDALDEAYAEMERGEGRCMEEALPALRDRLAMRKPPN